MESTTMFYRVYYDIGETHTAAMTVDATGLRQLIDALQARGYTNIRVRRVTRGESSNGS